MTTTQNQTQRRHLAIPNLQSAMPNSPSAEPDRMQHNPTGCDGMQRKLVPAREATAFHWISRGMDCDQLAADWTHRLERIPQNEHRPRRRQNPTECNTIQQDASGCNENSCPRARHNGVPLDFSRHGLRPARSGLDASLGTGSPKRTPTRRSQGLPMLSHPLRITMADARRNCRTARSLLL